MRCSSKRAFTLIELLVVVAIISLLLAILIPTLKGARELARTIKCKTNLKNIAVAHLHYIEENQQYYITRRSWHCKLTATNHTEGPRVAAADTLATADSVFRCPSGLDKIFNAWTWFELEAPHRWENRCAWTGEWTEDDGETWYMHNWYGVSGATWYKGWPVTTDPHYKLIGDKHPSKTIMNYDGRNIHNVWDIEADGYYVVRMTSARHGQRDTINMSFYDGHVDSTHYKKVQHAWSTSTDGPRWRQEAW
jgi:prepilin-type N-terminal cleavage/methylation domain-containing protein/prepilin-type processing-associated H-X9-DG protein